MAMLKAISTKSLPTACHDPHSTFRYPGPAFSAIAMVTAITTVTVITATIAVARVCINGGGKDSQRNNRRKCSFEGATLNHDAYSLRGNTHFENMTRL